MNSTHIATNQDITSAKQILAVTLIVTLISVAGIALPYPVLAPLFANGNSLLTQFLNLPSELLLGIVLGIYPLGIIIGSSMIGSLSDRHGRKRLLTLTLMGSAIGYGLTAMAAISEQYLLFCIARLLTGFCEGNIAIARAIAADLHPTIDKTRSFSLISAMGYGGYLIGPLAGGYLLYLGVDSVFWVAAAACLACAVFSHCLLPEKLNTPCHNASKSSSLTLLKDPALKQFFIIYLLLTMGVNLYYEFYPLHLVRLFEYTSIKISWATVLLTASMITTSVWINPCIQKRLSHASASLIGIGIFIMSLLSFPFLGQSAFLITFVTTGAGIAIYSGFLPSYLSTAYQDRPQGQLMGMLVTIFCLGNLLAALVGGVLAIVDVKIALLAGSLTTFVAFWLFYVGHNRHKLWPQN
ncbi:MFS transporter [Shewanella mesophila]|uniref:MFS transporter n=1 Tax=Shewanella mesophila TaxID=2864208 RepID=UPI001C655BBC|nr:MFS transporter [Shewanella mesophila]QYJ84959.1 MFS transporter [Shewanella mesophila]